MVMTRLHVLDVNEHAPSFHSQPYVVHVAENTPPHTSLVQRQSLLPLSSSTVNIDYLLQYNDSIDNVHSNTSPFLFSERSCSSYMDNALLAYFYYTHLLMPGKPSERHQTIVWHSGSSPTEPK